VFVDSHAHLEGHRYDSDRESVIARARDAGVETIVAIGNGDGPVNFDCGIQLAEKYDFIYATIGIHPHEAKLADQAAFDRMAQLAKRAKVIAWGEIGLDYYYDHSPRAMQQDVFIQQMELGSRRTGRNPALLHRQRRPGQARARHGVHGFLRWQPHLSQGPADPRRRARGAARSRAD
jgi:TatD DNase family protein